MGCPIISRFSASLVVAALLITISAKVLADNPATVSYLSSLDSRVLSYHEYLPSGHNSSVPHRLAILLPGSGGNIYQYDIRPEWRNGADTRGFILVTIQPRLLPGFEPARSTFYIDGALAPGEQDVLDAIAAVRSRHAIEPTRIYIGGYSMGGCGALKLATHNPELFAAVAAGAPLSDLFQEASFTTALTPSFATLIGGAPGENPIVDTVWYQNSPRFLLPNLMNTPLHVLHGTADQFIPNSLAVAPYMHSRHILDISGYSDSRGSTDTLAQLQQRWPGFYIEEHAFPSSDHGVTSLAWTADTVLSFFDAHRRPLAPMAVALTAYDDIHTKAYWLKVEPTYPWTASPGAAFVRRAPETNTVQLQTAGSSTVTLDLPAMQLSTTASLSIAVSPVSASDTDFELHLLGTWPTIPYTVKRDGEILPPSDYVVTPTQFILRRQTNDSGSTYTVAMATPAGCTISDVAASIDTLRDHGVALRDVGAQLVSQIRGAARKAKSPRRATKIATAGHAAEARIAAAYAEASTALDSFPRLILDCPNLSECSSVDLGMTIASYQAKVRAFRTILKNTSSTLGSLGTSYRKRARKLASSARSKCTQAQTAAARFPATTYECVAP